jgi:hypothetical protein
MSQYDAAAIPLYASFGTRPTLTPFNSITPHIDVNAKNDGNIGRLLSGVENDDLDGIGRDGVGEP